MTDAEILEAVADRLFVHGRARSARESKECLLQAMSIVMGGTRSEWSAWAGSSASRAFGTYLVNHGLCAAPLDGSRIGDRSWMFNNACDDDAFVIDSLKLCAKELHENER